MSGMVNVKHCKTHSLHQQFYFPSFPSVAPQQRSRAFQKSSLEKRDVNGKALACYEADAAFPIYSQPMPKRKCRKQGQYTRRVARHALNDTRQGEGELDSQSQLVRALDHISVLCQILLTCKQSSKFILHRIVTLIVDTVTLCWKHKDSNRFRS